MAIYKRDIADINLETGNIHRTFLNHSIGSGDNNANAFGVRLFRDNEPVNIGSGWVQGFFRNSHGENIALTQHGVIDGNEAYVTLPQACYNYEGQFTLAIKIVSPGSANTVTMRIVDGIVDNTNTGSAVAPTGTVPTYQEVLAAYEQAVTVIDKSVRFDTTQSLTDTQKATARTNIGAASVGTANELAMDIGALAEGFANESYMDLGNKYMPFRRGYYSTPAVGSTSSYQSNSQYFYALVMCQPGDILHAHCYGNSTVYAWAFLDSNLKVLSRGGTGNFEGTQTAPASTSYVLVNVDISHMSTGFYAWVGEESTGEKISDLKSAIVSTSDEINELHSLVDYKYHTPYFRNPDPSKNNTLKLGIDRNETIIVLNGTLNYTSSMDARVRLNGDISTTNDNGTVDTWTTNTISLITGHKYNVIARLLSGTAPVVPAIGIVRSGEHTIISTGTRTGNTYVAEFTAEIEKTYNVVLYCGKNSTYVDAKILVYMIDVTASEETDSKSFIGQRVSSLEDIVVYGMKKKFIPSDFVNGYWSSQQIVDNDKAICISALFDVNAGDKIAILDNPDNLYFAYGVYVGSSTSASDASGWLTGTHEHTFTVTGKMFIQCVNALASADRTDISPSDMTLDIGILDDGYLVENIGSIMQVIHTGNKKIAFLGDSITAGVGTNNIYHMYLGDRFGWTCKNYGYGGSGYARSYPSTGGKMATGQTGMGVTITNSNKFEPNDFLARIATIDPTIDALVIFGGTNDWAHGDVISVETFRTAVNNVFSYAQTNFGRIPIIVLLPIHRGNDSVPDSTTGKTLEDYCNIIKEIGIPYGIKCIDLFAESGLNPSNQHNNDLYYIRDDTNVSDSLHPNHYAHKVISNLIASALYDSLY